MLLLLTSLDTLSEDSGTGIGVFGACGDVDDGDDDDDCDELLLLLLWLPKQQNNWLNRPRLRGFFTAGDTEIYKQEKYICTMWIITKFLTSIGFYSANTGNFRQG